ncbi:MAG TPA: ribose-5-phosphate isomerase RpiA [Candidatus Dormibacteraeota bacterium]
MDPAPADFQAAASAVAERAAGLIRPGMRLGLGTGRMASALVMALGPRVKAGLAVQGICTSRATEDLARAAGIELISGSGEGLDLDLDGADEFDSRLNALKGGGGALLREKIIAQRSRRLWLLVDASKEVDLLGSSHPLPVEVLPYDWEATAARCEAGTGAKAALRGELEHPALTDNGNYLLDLTFPDGLIDPEAAGRALDAIAGVLGHGLFLGLATAAILFKRGGVKILGDLDRERELLGAP